MSCILFFLVYIICENVNFGRRCVQYTVKCTYRYYTKINFENMWVAITNCNMSLILDLRESFEALFSRKYECIFAGASWVFCIFSPSSLIVKFELTYTHLRCININNLVLFDQNLQHTAPHGRHTWCVNGSVAEPTSGSTCVIFNAVKNEVALTTRIAQFNSREF